ncbi:UV radiation resistance associated protein [Eumeta japonica]|uniref:UV radiation resistance associated protein n=1 Tax=Eumeta variegata TaxID=151549 RepID=A0A4C1ZU26_EUMVA|nr:UV radiation resistance associated protein [Eumeta japonica]
MMQRSTVPEAKPERETDLIIQTWGVYFSGLRYIGANLALNFTSDSFKSNTLVFQMSGGYFCSYKSLKLDVIPPENQMEQSSYSSDSSDPTNLSQKSEPKFIQNHRFLKDSRSTSPNRLSRRSDRELTKSHSPVERGFKHLNAMRTSSSLNIVQKERCRDDSSEIKSEQNQIYEHSPDSLDVKEFTTSELNCESLSKNYSQEEIYANRIDLSETAENYDLRNEKDGMPKYRYLAMTFLKSEIRPSYDSVKLQKLHLLQYSIKKRQEAVQEVKERIYKKSALTNTEGFLSTNNQFEAKSRYRSRFEKSLFSTNDKDMESQKSSQTDSLVKNGRIKLEDRPATVSNGPRLTLKLNDLLSFKSKPSPLQMAEHVRLTKQLEILRFKRIILSDERDSKSANIRRLKERRAKLCEENQDLSSELMQKYHSLSRCTEALKETRQSASALRQLTGKSHAALASKRADMLTELHGIFYIEEKNESVWTICDVPLPICSDDNSRRVNRVTDAVAAGLVAQATCLTAYILNQPLRYKVLLLGSASKIVDISNELPDPNIPLYPRSGDVLLFRYAMFLLNKCIAQLLWSRGLPVMDIKPTLANLRRLMTSQGNLSDAKLYGTYKWLEETACPRTQSLRSLVASDRGKHRQFNRFKDSVDGQSPQTAMCLRRHRLSRSVGSCQDDSEVPNFDTSTTSIMGSEPSLYDAKLLGHPSQILKSHNSDSEISHMSIEIVDSASICEKVVFTLGSEMQLENLESQSLVRLSTNNRDITESDVKKICCEINNFCALKRSLQNSEDSIVNKNIEDAESNTCGLCDGREVCQEIGCAKSVMNDVIVNEDRADDDDEVDSRARVSPEKS